MTIVSIEMKQIELVVMNIIVNRILHELQPKARVISQQKWPHAMVDNDNFSDTMATNENVM